MSRRRLRRTGAARVIAEGIPTGEEVVIEHPDGYYWLSPDGRGEFGPFESRSAALADCGRFSEEAPLEGESVLEAEQELGVNDWVDPDTGAPAEGQSPPRLDES